MKKNKGFKRAVGLFLAIATVLTSTGMVFANSNGFTDITGHWAEDIIIEWSEMGIVSGYGDTFVPENSITRAEFMSLMNKTFFEDITVEQVEEADVFLADVAEGAWYADIVKKAVVAGYISGYGEGIMKPEANITREEVAAIFSNVFELEQNAEATEVFADLHTIGTWAEGFVGAVASAGFMTGYEEGDVRNFKGNQNITRAEAVVALNSALTIIIEDMFGGSLDDIIDEEIDFESIFGDLTEEELLVILQDLFGDFLGEDFFNNYENLTEEEVEAHIDAAFKDLESRLSTMTEEEMIETLDKLFGTLFEDEVLTEEVVQEIPQELLIDQETELESLE